MDCFDLFTQEEVLDGDEKPVSDLLVYQWDNLLFLVNALIRAFELKLEEDIVTYTEQSLILVIMTIPV